jgi:hypothetical protein
LWNFVFPFNRLSRRKLPILVRFEAQATCLQHTTVPGSNAARWARDGRELFFGQMSDLHANEILTNPIAKLFKLEQFWHFFGIFLLVKPTIQRYLHQSTSII